MSIIIKLSERSNNFFITQVAFIRQNNGCYLIEAEDLGALLNDHMKLTVRADTYSKIISEKDNKWPNFTNTQPKGTE